MSEDSTELSRPLVAGRKSDGRAIYDRQAKRELIEICLQSGMSIAALARKHSLNANLLHNWVVGHRRPATATGNPTSSFLPVQVTPSRRVVAEGGLRIGAELTNGVRLELSALDADQLPQILRVLSELPCSALTKI
jgi:transposase